MRPVEPGAEWDSLPHALRTAIQSRAGIVTGTSPAGDGLSTSVRLILHTESRDVFIKGTGPDSTGHQRRRLALGADLAPYVTTVSPPLLWRLQAGGWDVTGWPALPGRPWADQKPGSEDITKMIRLLTELSQIPAPDILTDTARGYWEQYADDPGALDGDAIVHRDPNPANFVIDGGQAWMVDFGWAVRGPAWMTSANLIVSMMEAGWEPADADNALKAVPAWTRAPRHAVDELARAAVREWEQVTERGPVHEVWQFRAATARAWARYRENITRFLAQPHAQCAAVRSGPAMTDTDATVKSSDTDTLIRQWRASRTRVGQIAAELAAKIDTGRLHRWEELPPQAALAEEYDVSESTISKVKRLLADNDFLTLESRRYFIATGVERT